MYWLKELLPASINEFAYVVQWVYDGYMNIKCVITKVGKEWQVDCRDGENIRTTKHTSRAKAINSVVYHDLVGVNQFYIIVKEETT